MGTPELNQSPMVQLLITDFALNAKVGVSKIDNAELIAYVRADIEVVNVKVRHLNGVLDEIEARSRPST